MAKITEVLDAMSKEQMRSALAFLSGYSPEDFQLALYFLQQTRGYTGPRVVD